MWLFLAFLSASLLGIYDVAKKHALRANPVLPVLWLNTLIASVIFSPALFSSAFGLGWMQGTFFEASSHDLHTHILVLGKACMVLSSWIFGYFGIKHLPITVVGPINATRPVMTLLGAMIIFSERLNMWQWAGVILAVVSLYMLSASSRKEGIDFKRNKWIFCIAMAAIIGAGCGLYDRHLMRHFEPMFVLSWYMFYQFLLMSVIAMVLWYPRRHESRFEWRWSIPLISLFLTCADFAYLLGLSEQSAMISVMSMIRRSSVLVSFFFGAMVFHERNLRAKALDLMLILVGMIFLYIGSRG